ncbi:TolC family protein [uncultured Bacteroides sp.]|uniref:TolC family protein n=1 Tax=uncultured Bacteroides sp. TaxID=162156 RepID=UPI0015A940DC|nr:TolC family protein [uncultured Bacteroides sp.]
MKTNRNRIIAFLLIGGACVNLAFGQKAYTLDKCIQAALTNNVKMKNARNELEMARQDKKKTFTNYFPSVMAAGTGFMADKGLMQMDLAPDMHMSMLKNGIAGGVSASLPLFTGGQIVNGNQLAKVGVEVKRLQQNLSDNEVTLTTEQYFWRVVTLQEKLKTLGKVETQLERILRDVEASVEAGVVTRNDLLQVQLRRNETKSSRLQLENALSISRNMLAQYTGLGSDSLAVAFSVDDRLPSRPDSLYCDPESALGLTSEYALLQQNVKASRLQYKMELGKNLPTVAIGGGYVYHNFLPEDQRFWVGFATVTVPLTGWWGGSHALKKEKLQVKNTENQLADQGELLVIRMKNAWNGVNEAYEQMKIARLSIEQATENLRLNTDYYKSGTCTMSDLLDAQTLFQQSCDKYVESYTDYELKKREYLQVTGRR